MTDQDDAPLPNPRRAPRLALRCAAYVELPGCAWASETEDIGLHGCQLVAPERMAIGQPLRLRLSHRDMPTALRVSGQVAWAGTHSPWRHGVAFTAGDQEGAARWLGRLFSRHPELVVPSRVPAWLEPDERLYLAAPPRLVVDFTAAELGLLRQVRTGATVSELRRSLGGEWGPSVAALFSLLARRALTRDRARSVGPGPWQGVLEGGRGAAAGGACVAPDGGSRVAPDGGSRVAPDGGSRATSADGTQAVARIVTVRTLLPSSG